MLQKEHPDCIPAAVYARVRRSAIIMARQFAHKSPWWITRDEDDLVALAIFHVWQAAQRFEPARGFQFSTYALGTVKYALLTYRERSPDSRLAEQQGGVLPSLDDLLPGEREGIPLRVGDEVEDAVDYIRQVDTQAQATYLLTRLPEMEREAISRYYLRQQPCKEIAAALKYASRKTIETVIHRGLRRMRNECR